MSTTLTPHVQGDAAARKAQPIARGCLDYFPDALLAVAEVSRVGNEQHNPGEPLHWAKEKSQDEADALLRHLIDRGSIDSDGIRHSAKVAWRALALLQREIDAERETDPPGTVRVPAHLVSPPPHIVERYKGQLSTATDCSICGRPECTSVHPTNSSWSDRGFD